MQLNYNNYLSSKTDSKFLSRNTLTDLNRVRQNDNRSFEFTIDLEGQRIVDQATLFANFISATGIFENSFLNNSNRIKSASNTIRDAYIYSFIKSVYYSFQLSSNSKASIMGPGSNIVFFGHKLLHDIICEGYIQHFTPPSNVISVELNPRPDTLEELKKFDLWDQIYDTSIDRVFNGELETVLNFLNTRCSNIVAMGNISYKSAEAVKNLLHLPIGNLCYSNDMLSILYVESEALSSDKRSFYWNKANLIVAVSIPEIDADDSIFDTILTQNYDKTGLTFEVESITGFSPLGGPRNAFDYTRGSNPNSYSPNPTGGNSSSRSNTPGSTPASNKQNPQNRGPLNNPRANLNTRLSMAKHSVERVSGNIVSMIRRVDEIMTSERVELVADIIQQITGKRPKIKTLRQSVGERLGSVLEKNGILFNDNLVGSDEEYAVLYLDSVQTNGQYKSELVGIQNSITSK